jgi:phosphoglycolate phosphatase-like HAD superfamily hydrolase
VGVIVGPYETWLFDCDGVLLDSNKIKTDAFHELAAPFGETVATALVEHHVAHGGISRFEKIRFLYEHLLGVPAGAGDIQALAQRYSSIVRERLVGCAEPPGVRTFLQRRPAGCRWYVVSGSEQAELRWVLAERQLAAAFDDIFGSPRDKLEIARELAIGPTILFGDSRYDHEVAERLGIDFVFVSGCTELADWGAYVADRRVRVVESLGEVQPQ